MSRVSRAGVLAAYRDGITVICELAAQFTDATWLAATPCAEWRAAELAGPLPGGADDYHEDLAHAPARRPARPVSPQPPPDSPPRQRAPHTPPHPAPPP